MRIALSRRSIAPLVAAALAVCCVLPRARAEAPAARDRPTLEQIYAEAQAAKEEAARLAAEAARDPRQETIDAYAAGTTPLAEYDALTDMINDGKSDEIQTYRSKAAEAILARFRLENLDDPSIRRVRNALALDIVDLMKTSSTDHTGLAIIQDVLRTWWRTKLEREIRFQATDKYKNRVKAWRKMRAFLQNGER